MISTLVLALSPFLTDPSDPHRQFDFWVGEWSVQNRDLQADGSWADGDVTRARITPVCGGKAVLEEWAGPLRGAFMNGFSLRAWDPEARRWALLLFWTADGSSSFGLLHGDFRHGRGEFFAGGGQELTRYTFSDALPDTVRWDSARSKDGGRSWLTDWIMEFSRTRPAAEVTQDELFAKAWTEGALSPHREARQLDWLVGTWRGMQTGAAGDVREARLRCKPLNKDCLVLSVLETRAEGAADWTERLDVRGWEPGRGAWVAWRVHESDTRLRRSIGSADGEVLVFEREGPGGALLREYLVPEGEDAARIEETRVMDTGEELIRTTVLARSAD